jgi:hypothetical protein
MSEDYKKIVQVLIRVFKMAVKLLEDLIKQ